MGDRIGVVRPSVLLAINPFLSWFKTRRDSQKNKSRKLFKPGLQLIRIEKECFKMMSEVSFCVEWMVKVDSQTLGMVSEG